MKTAAEYRAMAEECFKWARETVDDNVRASYLQLGQIWLDAAHKLDGLPATPAAPSNRRTQKKGQAEAMASHIDCRPPLPAAVSRARR